jgi:hypothetical protein
MTTVVTTSNTEVSTPTSYVSRWIAQSHESYQKKNNEYYTSSCNYRSSAIIPILKPSTKLNSNPHITTWQAQAKTRLDATVTTITSDSSNNINNNELQDKLNRVR